ncbi:transcription factor c2h2 [Pyrenophora seminiperda CCB06]|uniref:Transcription factor c2h2 n=1 Tax=Pyrenophora seminiperda CCB06 TaxID=1302712 RepID=A0A3M7M1Y4_9PLEO|nr:transcription factor c2h2 [Pyrenophora seminiperda CCB06]
MQASSIASPVPLRLSQPRQLNKDLKTANTGRDTPLPQYEKTQPVPLSLNLQEDARNPGQFQLVLNIGSKLQTQHGIPLASTATSGVPMINRDGLKHQTEHPLLYQTQKSSPPSTPLKDQQGWADLDHVPPDFLNKVVPDWKVSFSRSDSTASTQSRRLSDIGAKIKKTGKGYVVRLLKRSAPDTNEIAEVDLGQHVLTEGTLSEPFLGPGPQELESTKEPAEPVELYSPPANTQSNSSIPLPRPGVFEIGTSNEDGIQRPQQPSPPVQESPVVSYVRDLTRNSTARNSIAEDGFSDAETLIPEVRSIAGRIDHEQTDFESFSRNTSMLPTRSGSISSIVKTPTRGLSIRAVHKRVEKRPRGGTKNRANNLDLRRSDAQKSLKRRPPPASAVLPELPTRSPVESSILRERVRANSRKSIDDDFKASEYNTWQHPVRSTGVANPRHMRHVSADDLQVPSVSKGRLRLQTDIPQVKSAQVSPMARRKKSPRIRKSISSSASPVEPKDVNISSSPEWTEVNHSDELRSDELREALKKIARSSFADIEDENGEVISPNRSLPTIVEPVEDIHVGEIPLPSEVEIRSPPIHIRSPTLMYWGLAFSALSDKAYEGFKLLRDTFGSERPVPQGHVRVRWTCSCGESLYDDFIEQRPNAARLLEAFLNRPRAHTPRSPSRSPSSQGSSISSIASIFDASSRASTIATPVSTHGGPSSWSRGSDPSKYSPSRVRSQNPFSIRMPPFASESWLLTCANEGRLTPKIVHLDVNEGRIRSDKDLALALREHYDQLNARWFNWARLRGLTTIEFVQFEVHRNRFADIRATPSMPPKSFSSSASTTMDADKSDGPSQYPYTFEPNDLLPPVGSTYLVHLFKHPNDYDGEMVTYLRSPKRRQRLEFGMGWGVHLVEGFLAQRVWAATMGVFVLGSAAFAILWTVKKGDVQGAFGVAQWVLGVAVLLVSAIQAWLE